eukprot:12982686-Alexandrium_andersonii.AAC.1
MAKTPRREPGSPLRRPFRALGGASRWAPFHISTWGAAKRCPKLPCQSAFAHSSAPIGRRSREGSERPLWRD